MIIRSPRPETGYLTISNDVVRDSRLSYRSRGILLAILSRPDNWSSTAESLARDGVEGRAAIYTALQELEAEGYLVREKYQDEKGHWLTRCIVYDTDSRKPTVGSPTVGNTATIRKNDKDERQEDNPSFDRFWESYPRRTGKLAAQKAFQSALKHATAEEIIDGLHAAVDAWSNAGTKREYIPHPATWLNQGRWADEHHPQAPERAFNSPVIDAVLKNAQEGLSFGERQYWRQEGSYWQGADRGDFDEWLAQQPEDARPFLIQGYEGN